MIGQKTLAWGILLFAACLAVNAEDLSGTITATRTISTDSRFTGDVTCTVAGAACIVVAASGITLDMNGFSMTGLGDPETGCGGSGTAGELGIDINAQKGVVIQGPGLIQRFRNQGMRILNSSGVTVIGITASTNCFSGIFMSGGSDNILDGNISVRNGNLSNPCGGI